MLKKLMLLAILMSLGSCTWPWGSSSTTTTKVVRQRPSYGNPPPRDRDYDDYLRQKRKADRNRRYDDPFPIGNDAMPGDWLPHDFLCDGALRRGQWLLCENESLGQLHRRLAIQWETDRRHASPERVMILEAQQNAFISERDACEDVHCVAAAYYRYLLPPAVPVARPKPWYKPVRWTKPYRHHRHDDGWGHHDSDGALSCVADVGVVAAQTLVQKCSEVTLGNYGQCSIKRSCSSLRNRISRGCDETFRKPQFCPRLGQWPPPPHNY